MGLSCFRAISGWDGYGMGWDLCAGLFYEHRFAMLIIIKKLFHGCSQTRVKNVKDMAMKVEEEDVSDLRFQEDDLSQSRC